MTRNRAVLLSTLLLAILLAILFSRIVCQDDESPRPALTTRRVAATQPNLKVGVYLSKFTADQIDGYSCQMTAQLTHRNLDLVPLLEPDTQSDPRVAKILDTYFPGVSLVDVTDAEALKKLDVIVTPRIWFLPDEARTAIEAAVTNGTGLLLRNGFGCMAPGSGPDVSRINGFEESSFGYNPHPMECQVLANHPILGKLNITSAQSVPITPNGTFGKLGAKTIPLIKVKDMDAFREFEHRGQDDWTFYPLYISQLGKGRIIGCQFPAWEPTPRGLMAATDNEFNLRCVLWLAHRLDSPKLGAPASLPTSSPQ